MVTFDKSEEKLSYIFLIIISAVIGIAAVLLPFSTSGEIDLKMIMAMFICFAISVYFSIQYVIHMKEKKKKESISFDFKKELGTVELTENTKEKKKKKFFS